jgi:hypothetical protein
VNQKLIEKTAREILNSILVKSISERVEYGGMIYFQSGKYCATNPRTQGYRNTVDVGLNETNMSCPPDSTPVAYYHTHVNLSSAGFKMSPFEFSDEDKAAATDHSIDAYLGILDGSFLKFDCKLGKPLRLSGQLKNTE